MARRTTARPDLSTSEGRVFAFFRAYCDANDQAPTLAEIAEALELPVTTAWLRVQSLVRKGYVEKEPNVARGGRVAEDCDACPECGAALEHQQARRTG